MSTHSKLHNASMARHRKLVGFAGGGAVDDNYQRIPPGQIGSEFKDYGKRPLWLPPKPREPVLDDDTHGGEGIESFGRQPPPPKFKFEAR